jgi:hypothetical protein
MDWLTKNHDDAKSKPKWCVMMASRLEALAAKGELPGTKEISKEIDCTFECVSEQFDKLVWKPEMLPILDQFSTIDECIQVYTFYHSKLGSFDPKTWKYRFSPAQYELLPSAQSFDLKYLLNYVKTLDEMVFQSDDLFDQIIEIHEKLTPLTTFKRIKEWTTYGKLLSQIHDRVGYIRGLSTHYLDSAVVSGTLPMALKVQPPFDKENKPSMAGMVAYTEKHFKFYASLPEGFDTDYDILTKITGIPNYNSPQNLREIYEKLDNEPVLSRSVKGGGLIFGTLGDMQPLKKFHLFEGGAKSEYFYDEGEPLKERKTPPSIILEAQFGDKTYKFEGPNNVIRDLVLFL